MPHRITVDPVAGVVHARYLGEVTLEERELIIGAALERSREAGLSRILLDFREAHTAGADEAAYDRVAAYWAPRLMQSRLACLVTYDHQISNRIEQLVRARGVAVERFHDFDAAMAWLAEPDGDAGDAAGPPAAAAQAPPPTDPRRVQRLLREVLDPALRVPDGVVRAVEQLLRELLEAGLPEEEALAIARRMSLAILRAASAR